MANSKPATNLLPAWRRAVLHRQFRGRAGRERRADDNSTVENAEGAEKRILLNRIVCSDFLCDLCELCGEPFFVILQDRHERTADQLAARARAPGAIQSRRSD